MMDVAASMLRYDADSGILTWRETRKGRGCAAGAPAGTISKRKDTSYIAVMVHGKKLYAHRIIWHMHFGEIPDGMCIDHIDGNGLNNLIGNLRLASLSDNQRNSRVPANSRTRIQGVNNHSKAPGFTILVAGKYAGYTNDFFEACCIRKSAELSAGFHSNHGRHQ